MELLRFESKPAERWLFSSHMRIVCLFFQAFKINNAIETENRRSRAPKYINIPYAFFYSIIVRAFPVSTTIENNLRFFICAQRNLLLLSLNALTYSAMDKFHVVGFLAEN